MSLFLQYTYFLINNNNNNDNKNINTLQGRIQK